MPAPCRLMPALRVVGFSLMTAFEITPALRLPDGGAPEPTEGGRQNRRVNASNRQTIGCMPVVLEPVQDGEYGGLNPETVQNMV